MSCAALRVASAWQHRFSKAPCSPLLTARRARAGTNPSSWGRSSSHALCEDGSESIPPSQDDSDVHQARERTSVPRLAPEQGAVCQEVGCRRDSLGSTWLGVSSVATARRAVDLPALCSRVRTYVPSADVLLAFRQQPFSGVSAATRPHAGPEPAVSRRPRRRRVPRGTRAGR